VNTWVPPEKPEEAHTHLNPTCYYVVDMNFKIRLTSNTVTNHIATKQLADANMAFLSSLDMYQNKHPVDIGSNCGRFVIHTFRTDFGESSTEISLFVCHAVVHDDRIEYEW
jgi:hypothetical protein